MCSPVSLVQAWLKKRIFRSDALEEQTMMPSLKASKVLSSPSLLGLTFAASLVCDQTAEISLHSLL